MFKALHGQAPQCLTDDCQLVAAAGRRQLRSSDAVTCSVPPTRTCLGDRAFGVAGPRLWNALLISLRQPHLSLGQFWRALKRIYLTGSAGPSDFLFLGADYKWSYLLTYKMWVVWGSVWLICTGVNTAVLTRPLTSGTPVSIPALKTREDITHIHCDVDQSKRC